jgi:DNA-binding beta-propeller fold protein YncE
MLLFFRALQPKLLQALCAVVAISIAMSFSEVALTAQLSPPSTNQPIAVALLNAMHYQRPQIVSSALCVMLLLTASGGILVFLCSKRYAVVLLLAVCLPYSCKQYEQTPLENTSVIGSAGLSNGHFVTPRAMDSNDDVIVVIDKSGKLQIFNHAGEFISAIELELSGTGYPTGLSLDETGNIWIADTHQNRVLVVSQEGEEILSFGEYGTGEGQFLYPTDIAFGKQDEVYVSEYGGNDRISVFDTEGNYIRSIGAYTSELVSFRRPQSVVVDTDGLLYVADAGNHRVVVLTPMGEVVEIISDVGRGSTQLLYPYGILLDTPSTILVCEFGNNRLHQFSRSGESLGTWGSAGSDVGFLRTPWGIAKSGDGIVVADTGNNRLQVLPYMMNK